MKKYKYKAKKSATEVVEGLLDASTDDEAVEKINALGLVPVELDEYTEAAEKPAPAVMQKTSTKSSKIKSKILTAAYRQLSRLIKSGVPLLKAVAILADQEENAKLKAVLLTIEKDVREGKAFSESLMSFSGIFSSFEISLIKAGESVGQLDSTLIRIADYREQQEALLSKVKSAIAYPLFVFGLGVLTLIFMLVYVIPNFSRFFVDLGQELPLPTKLLIFLSDAALKGWYWIAIVGVIIFLISKTFMKIEANRVAWDRLCLSLPLLGKVLLMTEIARFSRTLELLLKSGVNLTRCIQVTLPILGNRAIQQDLMECPKEIQEGGAFSDSLRSSRYFPKIVVNLIRIGEESGKLDDNLSDIADWYEQESAERIKIMTQLIEPLMILGVGLMLGLMIVAVLLPIFSMNAMVT